MVRLCRKLSFRTALPHYAVSSGPLARCTCHTFATPSLNVIPGIYPVEAFAYFSQSLGFLAGPPSLGTWGEPAAFPCTFQEAVFYSEGIPLGPQRLNSWALIRNLLPTGPLVPILFRSQNLDDIAVF
jgi:hypothetical protein